MPPYAYFPTKPSGCIRCDHHRPTQCRTCRFPIGSATYRSHIFGNRNGNFLESRIPHRKLWVACCTPLLPLGPWAKFTSSFFCTYSRELGGAALGSLLGDVLPHVHQSTHLAKVFPGGEFVDLDELPSHHQILDVLKAPMSELQCAG